MAATPLKEQLKSPSLWLSVLGGLTTIGAGLTDTGNPTLIAIGTAVIAVHAIAQAVVDALTGLKPTDEKASAIIPILVEQVASVQNLVKTVEDTAKINYYRLKGYEVTPHDPSYVTGGTQPANQTSTATVGGEHQVIGVPR